MKGTREAGKGAGIPGAFRHSRGAAFVCLLLLLQVFVFVLYRDQSYPQVHDNLDLFTPHYRMMKLADAWLAHGVTLPVMHGLNRDLFGSEFLLYNLLYILFPDITAYLLGYFLKIAIGIASFLLLARDFAGGGERFLRCFPVLFPVAAAFGMLPVFPTYGIAFASVPLVVWLLRRIYYGQSLRALDAGAEKAVSCAGRLAPYLALFCYPTLSYFSYHGFFILCYMVMAFLILWARDRKPPLRLFTAIIVLSLGYVAFEYRLFAAMLLDDTVTIRATMDHGDLSFIQALMTGLSEFVTASFHSQDSHTYLVLPVALVGAVLVNAGHFHAVAAERADGGGSERSFLRRVCAEPVNLLLGWIVLNCLNFGLYQYAPYRRLLETAVPKLTGFEFARTAYFNTFLWYALFAVLLVRFSDVVEKKYDENGGKPAGALRKIPEWLAVAAAVVVMFVPQVYNDFYYTVYNHAYMLVKHKETSRVNYREYYSAALFRRILRDMDYQGEWSAAYGMHPAILNYNGIASLDGYIGFYPQAYKEEWERVEEPAFAGSPWLKSYFEDWGARVCLYSGSDENTYEPLRHMELADDRLMADIDELLRLDCRYIFSRIRFSNADELGLSEVGTWSGTDAETGIVWDDSPYTITVYELPGWPPKAVGGAS